MEVKHAVLHGRMIGANFIETLLQQSSATAVHTNGNFVVLSNSLVVGRLLSLNVAWLKKGNFLRVVELYNVARFLGPMG